MLKEKLRTQKTVYPDKQVNINDWFRYIHNETIKTILNPNLNTMKKTATTDNDLLHNYRNEVIIYLQKFTGCPSYQICAEMADEYCVEIDFGYMATRPAKDTAEKICVKAFVS